jgi:hypothetical protein
VCSYSGRLALQRLNALHGRYNIANDDSIYTLGLFFLEPEKFTRQSDWRGWTCHEKLAQFNYWHAIGQRMNIHSLPSSFDEWQEWTEQYELKHMRFDESNVRVAEPLVELFNRYSLLSSLSSIFVVDSRVVDHNDCIVHGHHGCYGYLKVNE